jgi:putative methionine-R-sulfoxide reductase with GAF domain
MTDKPVTGTKTDSALDHVLTPPPVLIELLAAIQDLHAASELRQGLEKVADVLHRYVAYDNLGLLLLDPRGRELRFALARGYPPEVEEHWRFGLGQGLVGIAAQTGEPILVEDVRLDPRYIGASQPTRGELALPLKVKDRVIGVLDLGALQPGVFGPAELALLEPVAGQLAAAIDGARLTQNLLQQTQTLSLLHELAREFASILDRKKLLWRVADRIRRLIHYDVFSVMLWNEETRRLEPQLAVYSDGKRVRTARPAELGEGICGTAAALRQTLRIPNVQLDPRYPRTGWSGCSTSRAPAMTPSPRSMSTPSPPSPPRWPSRSRTHGSTAACRRTSSGWPPTCRRRARSRSSCCPRPLPGCRACRWPSPTSRPTTWGATSTTSGPTARAV